MASSQCDFTILHRELGNVAHLFATYDHASAPVNSHTQSHAAQQATVAVPSSPEISLFPNIAFAAAGASADSGGGGADGSAGVSVGDAQSLSPAVPAAPGRAAVLAQALDFLQPAFYDPSVLVSHPPALLCLARS